MKPARKLLNDLIDRRLWPVVLLLVGALVAVPLVLSKKSASPAPAPAATAAAPKATTPPPSTVQPAVSIEIPRDTRPLRHAHEHNPFVQKFQPRPVSAGPSSKSTASSTKGPAKATTTVTAARPAAAKTTAKKKATTAKKSKTTVVVPKVTYAVASVDVRFGRLGHRVTMHDVPRLKVLPGRRHPVLVYLGVLKDGKTAVFLVSANATKVEGDGRCRPTAKRCQVVRVKAHQTEFVDVMSPGGRLLHYRLDLRRVRISHVTTLASARAAYLRESSDGRALLRRAVAGNLAGLRRLNYDTSIGRLYYKPTTSSGLDSVNRDWNAGFGRVS